MKRFLITIDIVARGLISFAVLKYLYRSEIVDDLLFTFLILIVLLWAIMPFLNWLNDDYG